MCFFICRRNQQQQQHLPLVAAPGRRLIMCSMRKTSGTGNVRVFGAVLDTVFFLSLGGGTNSKTQDDAGTNAVSLACAGQSACGLKEKDKVGDYMTLFLVFLCLPKCLQKCFHVQDTAGTNAVSLSHAGQSARKRLEEQDEVDDSLTHFFFFVFAERSELSAKRYSMSRMLLAQMCSRGAGNDWRRTR
jgi:hypothetical protein